MRLRIGLLLVVLCSTAVFGGPPRDELKFIVVPPRAGVTLPLEAVTTAGGRVVSEYPAMHVVGAPAAAAERLGERLVNLGFEVTPLDELIRTPGRVINPRRDAPSTVPYGAGLYVLQYEAPPTAAWQTLVRQSGIVAVAPLPHQTTLICATAEQVKTLNRVSWVRYLAPYLREDKFVPSRAGDGGRFTIQMATTDIAIEAIERIRALVGGFQDESVYGAQLTAVIETDLDTARELVNDPFVLGVAPYVLPGASDERQVLSVTGVAAPTGQYLPWLATRGITPDELTRSAAIVDVADTGVDFGCLANREAAHADLRNRTVYLNGTTGGTLDPRFHDNNGHGTVVAGIVAGNPGPGIGSNNVPTTGTDLKEAGTNYYYGLGVAPGVRIGSTKILPGPAGTVAQWTTHAVNKNCNDAATPCVNATPLRSCVATVQTHSHNDYTDDGSESGKYNANAQAFDISVRDADQGGALAIPLAITISAGNYRQRVNDPYTTVLAPATAKNVISMGAAESNRPTSTMTSYDCDTNTTGGDNPVLRNKADGYDVLAYCSRRGTNDGRLKPDLIAPATRILSTRTTINNGQYCAEFGDPNVWGDPQYHGSSGTSFAAPVAAGSIALLRYYYAKNHFGFSPSPAMYKAMLVGGSRSVTGAMDRLETHLRGATYNVQAWPNAQQGFGMVNLNELLSATPVKSWSDQQVTLLQGQMFERQITVADISKPVRIVLTWTDAPGAAYATIAQVNNLNLRSSGPDKYKFYGNHMGTGGFSQITACPIIGACGTPSDTLNNVEIININQSRWVDIANRTFTVRVTAATLNGIGVPGQSGGANNQDFALFVMNGTMQ